jgi:hypothetical protein
MRKKSADLETKLLESLTQALQVELPPANSLDDFFDAILPRIRQHSEDLREKQFYEGKHYIEIRDDDQYQHVNLHIFNAESEYIYAENGRFIAGEWRVLGNKLQFGESIQEGIIYELAFLDDEYLILRRHGNEQLFERKYLLLVIERLGKKMEWLEAGTYLYEKYRNGGFMLWVVVFLIIAALMTMLLLR